MSILPNTKGNLRRDDEITEERILLQHNGDIHIISTDDARAMVGDGQHLVEIGTQQGSELNGLLEGEYPICIITTERLAKVTLGNAYKVADSILRGKLYEQRTVAEHIKEQIDYRKRVCEPCLKNGRCLVCGCKTPGRFYSAAGCADGKYPALKSERDWLEWKNERGIE